MDSSAIRAHPRRTGRVVSRTTLIAALVALAACTADVEATSPSVSPDSTSGEQSVVPDQSRVLKYFGRYTSDRLGQIELTGILDIRDFHTVNLEIDARYPGQARNLKVRVITGKISGTTFAVSLDHFTLDFRQFGHLRIHSYDVIGPELVVWILGATPNTDVDVQAWVFLH
jgi:hypothetical protein